MSQTISTKYINPTNTRGAKVKATASGEAGSVTVPYDYNDEKQGHIDAAQKLKDKLGWKGTMYGGHTKDGYVFVFDDGMKINPVPPLKSRSKTDRAANKNTTRQGYVRRPSQITKRAPTQRLQARRKKTLDAPKGVFANPVKKGLTARPRKAKDSSKVFIVEMSSNEKTGFKVQGIFPTQKLATDYAKALDKLYDHKKFIRVRV